MAFHYKYILKIQKKVNLSMEDMRFARWRKFFLLQ